MEFLFDMFMNPSAGGAPIFAGTVTNPNGIKLVINRHCAAKEVITTTVPYSAKVKIYSSDDNKYFVEYKNIWGYYTGNDLLIGLFAPGAMNPEATEPENKEPETPKAEITKPRLLGTWSSVRRENNVLYTTSLTFNEDGTLTRGGCEYYHAHHAPFGDETGWYVAPMGYPSDYGTYKLEGSTLTITYLGSDFEEYQTPDVQTLVISSMENGKMVVNDRYGTYVKAESNTDILALCNALGVDSDAN